MPASVLREQGPSLMPALGCLERGKMEGEWAVMDLEEMMPEQSQTAAMGKRSQSSAWKGSKQLLM